MILAALLLKQCCYFFGIYWYNTVLFRFRYLVFHIFLGASSKSLWRSCRVKLVKLCGAIAGKVKPFALFNRTMTVAILNGNYKVFCCVFLFFCINESSCCALHTARTRTNLQPALRNRKQSLKRKRDSSLTFGGIDDRIFANTDRRTPILLSHRFTGAKGLCFQSGWPGLLTVLREHQCPEWS